VDRLGTYNEHLTTDVGAFYLAFSVLFGWAAARESRDAGFAACMAWTTFSLPHLAYHVTHLGTFPAADAVAQTGSLVLLTLVPLALIYALGGTRVRWGAGARPARSGLPFRARTGSDHEPPVASLSCCNFAAARVPGGGQSKPPSPRRGGPGRGPRISSS
jgi:hypothetical protein